MMDKVKHFLESEIEITKQRLNSDDKNPFYDGVCVGHKESVALLQRHIWFCQYLLKLIEKESDKK